MIISVIEKFSLKINKKSKLSMSLIIYNIKIPQSAFINALKIGDE